MRNITGSFSGIYPGIPTRKFPWIPTGISPPWKLLQQFLKAFLPGLLQGFPGISTAGPPGIFLGTYTCIPKGFFPRLLREIPPGIPAGMLPKISTRILGRILQELLK